MLRHRYACVFLTTMCCLSITPAIARNMFPDRTLSINIRTDDAPQGGNGVVSDLPLQDGSFQRVLYLPPARNLNGLMIMFAGGTGELDIGKNGSIRNANNFVVRSSDLWRDRGYGVLLVDALDHRSLRGQRSSGAYAEVTAKIIAFAHEISRAPLWVLGTSQGSIAAMNAASHAGKGDIAGLILTESVSILGGSHETVFYAHPEDVHVPSLIVANDNDQCKVAPPSMADAIAQSIRHARASVLKVKGGVQRSQDGCGSLSPHGYYGMEEQVVDGIVRWMKNTRG
ncbi:Alpha/beta hydrolase family protein [Caballeronia sordidicola]|uniref:Alpha/beta hydrolase family protein n=2 Tax=Caballeronia sordidicola TaxID=196367 RepID=A0A158HVR2_CABSO|nr:Alpha/beta hydrolase family protein [Caballeronia sordidicola]